MAYEPMKPVRTIDGTGMPALLRIKENATQTFKTGVPVTLSSGLVQEAAFGGAELCLGISAEAGHNLGVAGTAEEGTSEGTPVNQASAKIIPVGAWPKDGMCGVYIANSKTVFSAKLLSGQTFSQALISATRYALKKDGVSLYWYVDNTDSGTNDEHCANIVGVDPNDNTRVFFTFNANTRLMG